MKDKEILLNKSDVMAILPTEDEINVWYTSRSINPPHTDIKVIRAIEGANRYRSILLERLYNLSISIVKQTVIDVLNILEGDQDSYIDPAEHIYDAVKVIKKHLDDEDLIMYVGDFISGLSSSVNGDFDGKLDRCIKMLRLL